MKGKRGISPIVAMVLLIAISVIAAVGVYFWIGQYTSKPGTPSMPEMMSISTIGNGKVMVVNLGQEPLNLTTLRTSDPHVWVTMCEVNASDPVLGPGEQAVCDLLTNSGFNGSKTVEVYGNGTNIVALPVNEETADRSLVGWWSFDDVKYNSSVWIAPDDSGNGNDGVLYNGSNACTDYNGGHIPSYCPQIVNGVRGKALKFDGENDYISIPNSNSLNMSYGLTLMAWAKMEGTTPSYQTLISKPSYPEAYRSWIEDTRDYYVFSMSTRVEKYFNTISKLNKWSLITTAFNRGIVTGYVNNSRVGTDNNSEYGNIIKETDMGVRIGKSRVDSECFNGTMDDVMIFNRALDANEVNWLYKWGLPHQ